MSFKIGDFVMFTKFLDDTSNSKRYYYALKNKIKFEVISEADSDGLLSLMPVEDIDNALKIFFAYPEEVSFYRKYEGKLVEKVCLK